MPINDLPYWLRRLKFKIYVAERAFESMRDEEIDIEAVPEILMEVARDINDRIKDEQKAA